MKLGPFLLIIRPLNCFMIGLAVIVGEVVATKGNLSPYLSVSGFLTGFLVCAYSMVTNDVYDKEVDSVNRPDRPIPSGLINERQAVFYSFSLLCLGLLFSFLTFNLIAVLISVLYSFLSFLYNYRFKKYGLIGNAIVSSSLAIPFLYGGSLYNLAFSPLLLIMALTSFAAGMGREVIKTVSDVKGDMKRGIISFAIAHGERNASLLSASFFLLAVLISVLPIVMNIANTYYRIGIIFPDAIFILLSYYSVRKGKEEARRIKNAALLGMLVGLFVFIGGAI